MRALVQASVAILLVAGCRQRTARPVPVEEPDAREAAVPDAADEAAGDAIEEPDAGLEDIVVTEETRKALEKLAIEEAGKSVLLEMLRVGKDDDALGGKGLSGDDETMIEKYLKEMALEPPPPMDELGPAPGKGP
jgi:hypothetical protein